jgi:hypothetical protein
MKTGEGLIVDEGSAKDLCISAGKVNIEKCDGGAYMELAGGGRIEAVINDEGKPQLDLTGPLNIGVYTVWSR